MKQVAKKTLGVAVMSAAAVAAGAGAASALGTDALGPLAETATGAAGKLPVENAAKGLPSGVSNALGATTQTAQDTLDGKSGAATNQLASGLTDGSNPGGNMLGGLPVGKGLLG
ncbi:hypothetical protein [Streptomyces sp. NRRL S-1868]|uniref:hypothetical protein n=1 Tax=Streptomyces sp. NRRL S-1868 TaxID=1463892 RepID=UPI00056167C2|nr:hypothetical protein [Streptomyces sp. NRRL S-1868]